MSKNIESNDICRNDICLKILKATTSAIYRRNKNLKDIFVKGNFTEATLKNNSVNLNIKKWKTVETTIFNSNTHNAVIKIKRYLTCNSDWVIHLRECKFYQKMCWEE